MKVLFVNAAFRENSRTYVLAQQYLSILTDEIETVNLGGGRYSSFAESFARKIL